METMNHGGAKSSASALIGSLHQKPGTSYEPRMLTKTEIASLRQNKRITAQRVMKMTKHPTMPMPQKKSPEAKESTLPEREWRPLDVQQEREEENEGWIEDLISGKIQSTLPVQKKD